MASPITERIASSLPCMLLLCACGPTVTVSDSGPQGESGGSTTDAMPTTTTAATTVGPVTSATGDTTLGPLDTGVFETGEVPLDLPQWCSVFEQDCPPGTKCTSWGDQSSGWNSVRCVPIDPDPAAPGQPCTVQERPNSGLDDCDGTSMCWDVDPKTLEGTCVPYCIGDESNPTCADPCDFCPLAGDGSLAICLGTCDPIVQDCGPGRACYPTHDTFVCMPDVSPPGTGIGSPCEFINGCSEGTFCLAAQLVPGCEEGSVGCCAPACALGGMDPCPGLLPGTECTAWYEEGVRPEGCIGERPGVCVTPQA